MTEEKQMCGLECERGVVEGEKKSSRAWRDGTEKEAEWEIEIVRRIGSCELENCMRSRKDDINIENVSNKRNIFLMADIVFKMLLERFSQSGLRVKWNRPTNQIS